MAAGSRFLRDSGAARVPRMKHRLLPASVDLNWLATGDWLSDTHCGFSALSRGAAQRVRIRENGYAPHATEVLDPALRAGLRIKEGGEIPPRGMSSACEGVGENKRTAS